MSSKARSIPSLQEQFARLRKRRKHKHVCSTEEGDMHSDMHGGALLHEKDLERQDGDEMQVDDTKVHEPQDNDVIQVEDTKVQYETTRGASHEHIGASLSDPSKEPQEELSYEELKEQLEKSQQALLASQEQHEVYREQSQKELEASREQCKELRNQLESQKAELQVYHQKYSDLKEKFYKWYHHFLKVWAEKFRRDQTEEPPPGIPNMSPRDSEKDSNPVVTPSPWVHRPGLTSSMEPKRLSASLHGNKETMGTSTKSIDSAQERRVDSLIKADESDAAGSETQLNGPSPEKRSTLEKARAESTSFGGRRALEKDTGIDSSPVHEDSQTQLGYDPRAYHETKEGEELAVSKTFSSSRVEASSARPRRPIILGKVSPATSTKAVLPVKDISNRLAIPSADLDHDHEDRSQALFSQLSETPQVRQPLGRAKPTLNTLEDHTNVKPASARKAMQGCTSNVIARTFVQSVSTLSVGKQHLAKEEKKPPSVPSEVVVPETKTTLIEPKRLSSSLRESDSKETMTRGSSKKGVDSAQVRKVHSPIKADESDAAGSETQLNGPSHEKRCSSPANASMEPKRLSVSLHKTDYRETTPRSPSKKEVDPGDKKTWRVDSTIEAGELDDAGGETQLNGPSPKKRSRLEKVGAESMSFDRRRALDKDKETGTDSSPVHEGSQTRLGYDLKAYPETKGIEGEALAVSRTLSSNFVEASSARPRRPIVPDEVSPVNDISNRPAEPSADHNHEDPSQALFSQLSETLQLRQPLGRAKLTPGTLKDRTNVMLTPSRKAMQGWTSNAIARTFVQSVSIPSVGKKHPAKGERTPVSVPSEITVPETETTDRVPSEITVSETETADRNTGSMQPPRNPYAAQKPFVAKAAARKHSTSKASTAPVQDQDSEDSYKYQDVVRCKHDRQALPGHECPQCSNWVDAVCHGRGGAVFNRKELMDCSRHRAAHSPENTPEGFWELSFADEIEDRKRQLARDDHPSEGSDSENSI